MRSKTSAWLGFSVLGIASCIGLGRLAVAASAPLPADELQQWIAGHSVAVRTVDATDQDFSDLEPLIDAIGSARVVQLGEASHGAGSSFAAKARLVLFLHQRMGFDVLAWESGLYDVQLTQAGMRAGDAVAAAQAGILLVWSAAEEVKPLFEYAKASQSTGRPLDMAATDMMMNAADAPAHFGWICARSSAQIATRTLRSRADALAEQTIAAHQRLSARGQAMRRIELDSVRAAVSGKAPAQSAPEARAAWEKSNGTKFPGNAGADGRTRCGAGGDGGAEGPGAGARGCRAPRSRGARGARPAQRR